MFATAPSTDLASSNEWYLMRSNVASFSWSSSSTPDSIDGFAHDGFAHQANLFHQTSNTTTANPFTQLSQITLNALCPIVLATDFKGLSNQFC